MDSLIEKRVKEWTTLPFNEETRAEIKELVDKKNEKELTERFFTTLEFGTGGLRGIIAAGTNRMNIYTVGMATQGLANYIISQGGADRGIVIACDSRRKSDIFSREAAMILAANGIKVYLFDDIMPTPLCSFAIRHLKAISGIVITASHNPPEYNGYKVYWDDGGQIIPPQDTAIITEVGKVDSINKIRKIDFEEGKKKGKITIIGEEIRIAYISQLEKVALRPRGNSDLKIVYSPLHGTGYKIMPRVLMHFGFNNLLCEPEQSIPDGNFPTVEYPNPEEKATVQRAVDLAKAHNADLLLATDPDADRMGVGFKDDKGEYLLISGNQIGTMLEYYILQRKKENGTLPENAAIIKTIVTTDLQSEIARDFNCKLVDVLTGFKWIGSEMAKFDKTGSNTFIFGGEESYGYLPVNFVRDKDAISSCYFFVEMADWLRQQNRSLYDFLKEIHLKYSVYHEDLKSLTLKGLDGMDKINRIMTSFRTNPPKVLGGLKVTRVDDIKSLKRIDILLGKEENIEGLPPSNVLQFFLEDGSKVTVRPSGTEPKIKFYFSVRGKATAANYDEIKNSLKTKTEAIRNDLVTAAESL